MVLNTRNSPTLVGFASLTRLTAPFAKGNMYDGDTNASTTDKLAAVKGHVKAITDMVAAAKAGEVAEAEVRGQDLVAARIGWRSRA